MDQSSHIQIQTHWRFPSLNDSKLDQKVRAVEKIHQHCLWKEKAALPFHHNTIQRKILTKEEFKRLDAWLTLLQSTWEEGTGRGMTSSHLLLLPACWLKQVLIPVPKGKHISGGSRLRDGALLQLPSVSPFGPRDR